jgi:HPt (histidine-containing phosphotransfer) domain-containing protein
LQESSDLLAQIYKAIDENDCPTLRRAGHTLKGQMRMFGASEPERLARCIENTATDGSVQVSEPLARLQQQIDQVHRELRDLLEGNIALG